MQYANINKNAAFFPKCVQSEITSSTNLKLSKILDHTKVNFIRYFDTLSCNLKKNGENFVLLHLLIIASWYKSPSKILGAPAFSEYTPNNNASPYFYVF